MQIGEISCSKTIEKEIKHSEKAKIIANFILSPEAIFSCFEILV